ELFVGFRGAASLRPFYLFLRSGANGSGRYKRCGAGTDHVCAIHGQLAERTSAAREETGVSVVRLHEQGNRNVDARSTDCELPMRESELRRRQLEGIQERISPRRKRARA